MLTHMKLIAFIALAISSSVPASAQEARKGSYRAGDVLHYVLKIDGPGSEKFTSAYFILHLVSAKRPEQEKFGNDISSGWLPKSQDGTVRGEIRIPELNAAGD